jgi:hypothetical protein
MYTHKEVCVGTMMSAASLIIFLLDFVLPKKAKINRKKDFLLLLVCFVFSGF